MIRAVSATGSSLGAGGLGLALGAWGAAGAASSKAAVRASNGARQRTRMRDMVAPGSGLGRRVGCLHLHLVSRDADRIAADLEPGIVGPGAVGQAETPGVPGTG